MTSQASTPHSNTDERPFFAALMKHLMQGVMIPKVQVERSVGPIIGFFLAEALMMHLHESIVMLCPEFPLLKEDANQSTNIDWLMFNSEKQELLLVELKTTDTAFRHEQAAVYQRFQRDIASKGSAKFIVDDLKRIGAASQERGKYQRIRVLLAERLGLDRNASDDELREILGRCKSARVIFLAPQVCKPKDWATDYANWLWISFAELPLLLEEHSYAEYWPALRECLVPLDTLTRGNRNGDSDSDLRLRNYRDLLSFDLLLERCKSDGASCVVGLINWQSKLPGMTLEELRARTYKYDLASGGIGKKIGRNWVPGDIFLAHATKLDGTHSN